MMIETQKEERLQTDEADFKWFPVWNSEEWYFSQQQTAETE